MGNYEVLNCKYKDSSRKFVVCQTESWAAITYKTTPDFSACPSFEVLRQETPWFRVVPIKNTGGFINRHREMQSGFISPDRGAALKVTKLRGWWTIGSADLSTRNGHSHMLGSAPSTKSDTDGAEMVHIVEGHVDWAKDGGLWNVAC